MLLFKSNQSLFHKPAWIKLLALALACSASPLAIGEEDTGYSVYSRFILNGKFSSTPETTDPTATHDEEYIAYVVPTIPPVARGRAGKMWAYGNPEGRVRLSMDTDLFRNEADGLELNHLPQITVQGTDSYPLFSSVLLWKKTYIKGNEDAKTTAEILPSFLRFYAPSLPDGAVELAEASMHFKIDIRGTGKGVDGLFLTRDTEVTESYTESLYFYLYVEGFTNVLRLNEFDFGLTQRLNGKELPLVGGTNINSLFPDAVSKMTITGKSFDIGFVPANTYYFDTVSNYKHTLTLSHLMEGEVYEIIYYMSLYGGTYTDQFVWGYFADPLNSNGDNSGIRIETTDLPANVGLSSCRENFDSKRYQINPDDTVTDRYTALSWQRCPVHYSLDDNATPDNISDDSCVADVANNNSYDWQTALQLAGENTLAGKTDWRLPNIKELETLVADCDNPTIEPEVFPDTPRDSGFWSSTSGRFLWQQSREPLAISEDAWQLLFSSGNLQTNNKTELAYGRLVRDSGLEPVIPVPAIYAGRSSIEEGDSGSSIMQIPVVLSKPGTDNISFDYAVTAPNNNAVNGTDFDETSGILTFGPGETRKLIPVTVYGNIDSENNKYLDLTLSNASANSRIAVTIGVSIIYDDDPVISLSKNIVQVYEGDSAGLSIPVYLDKPAAQSISVDYLLVQGTGEYSDVGGFINGTAIIAPGTSSVNISFDLVDDFIVENDETMTIQLSNPLGAKLQPGSGDVLEQTVVIVDDDHAGTYSALNDTGLTECVSDTMNALTCPQAGFPGQDAERGRDADPAKNDPADGDAGFSFSKLDAAGSGLPDDASTWLCVNDNVTGLIWETKTTSGLHDQAATYSWYNSSGINDGGYAGVNNGGVCSDAGNCDTEKFVAAVNAEALCGFTNWRLPTIDELFTLVDLNDFTGELELADGGFFPHSQLSSFSGPKGPWSSTTVAGGKDEGTDAWYLTPSGIVKKDKGLLRTTPLPVRLVTGGI